MKGKYTIVNGIKLTNRDAADQLLSDKFPDIRCLSTPLLGQTLTFHSYDCFEAAAGLSYVKVLHCPKHDHWLTLQMELMKKFEYLIVIIHRSEEVNSLNC